MEVLRKQYSRYGTQNVTITVNVVDGLYTIYEAVEIPTCPRNNHVDEHGSFRMTGGVPRWTSNNRVIPSWTVRDYFLADLPGLDVQATMFAEQADNDKFVAEYRKAQRNRKPSGEEMFEMRAAFGRGTTVVNVLTGRKVRL